MTKCHAIYFRGLIKIKKAGVTLRQPYPHNKVSMTRWLKPIRVFEFCQITGLMFFYRFVRRLSSLELERHADLRHGFILPGITGGYKSDHEGNPAVARAPDQQPLCLRGR